MEFWSTDLML